MTVKKTFPKILWLIISSSIFFIILFSALFYYTKKAENKVYKDSVKQFENEINKLIDLESKPILVAINNDTNWDEFVEFVTTKDSSWYRETIDNELEIYNADYLGAYDVDKKFIIRTPTPKIKTLDLIPKQAMDLLGKKGIKRFYLKIPEGIAEVTGASIHPSDDPQKKTKCAGYFFVARLMDSEYLKNLETTTGASVRFVDSDNNVAEKENKIDALYELRDPQNNSIGKLKFERDFDVYFENITDLLYIIIATFFIGLLINLAYTRRLVYHPLDLIRKVLEKSDKKAISELKNTTGEFSYIGNLFEENSNQKKELINAKIKAEEGDRLKSAFLANLSHEIRTPMNAINGFTDLIINTEIDENEKLEYLRVIEKSGRNLVSIIDDLIEMSKIDSNQITPNYTAINLESCVNELYETVKITIQKSKAIEFILIKSSVPAEFDIVTDDIKLKQVIINLLTNAIKFTDKGFVTFGYEIDDESKFIHFTVKDTGLGIDDVDHANIFDRFKRVDSDVSIKVGGLGLGLAISKAYIELLGGTISLESKVGEGSTFYFSIPLNYNKVEHIVVKPIKNDFELKSAEEITILIAEDDNINFLLFQKMMQHLNYKIIRAKNGEEAVDICINNPGIDIVLMDIKMPVMDGFEAMGQIRPIRPNLSIIAQTAYSSSEDKIKIEEAGFTDYITKPLNRERLFELITKYLNGNNFNEV